MLTTSVRESLVERLFDQATITIPGISYAVGYNVAEALTGGDIVDVYHYDNNCVAFAIAGMSGAGPAVNAALIKFGLRAFGLFEGMTTERVTRAFDWLYLQNNAFGSVFFAVVDPTRRLMTYTNAGHEPVLLIAPDGSLKVLAPTAPLVGIFGDHHRVFKQAFVEVLAGSLFVGATDGVTEARNNDGDLFGMERFMAAAVANRNLAEPDIVQSIVNATLEFSASKRRDHLAIAAVRFL